MYSRNLFFSWSERTSSTGLLCSRNMSDVFLTGQNRFQQNSFKLKLSLVRPKNNKMAPTAKIFYQKMVPYQNKALQNPRRTGIQNKTPRFAQAGMPPHVRRSKWVARPQERPVGMFSGQNFSHGYQWEIMGVLGRLIDFRSYEMCFWGVWHPKILSWWKHEQLW